MQEGDLEECENFEFPNRVINNARVEHSGFDNIELEWIRLIFDDSFFVDCPDDQGVSDIQKLKKMI